MKKFLIIVIIILAFVGIWYYYQSAATDTADGASLSNTEPATNQQMVTLKTNKGDIVLDLFADKTPQTVTNFVELSKIGFYNGTKFHRVINGFMIQGGDPNTKETDVSRYGQGGPGYNIVDEFAPGLSNARGTISMANTGQPNSGGSQFFINLTDNSGLDFDKEPITSKHAVFGKVVSGMEVVDAIAAVQTGPNDRPIEDVVIESVIVG